MKGDKQEQRQSSGRAAAEQRQPRATGRKTKASKANMKGHKQEQRQSSGSQALIQSHRKGD